MQAHTLANKKYEPVALCRFFDDRGDSHLNKGVARIELCLLLGLKTCAIRYPCELELALDLRIPPPLTAKRDIILKRLLLKGRSFFIDIATNEFIRMVAISIKETLFTARLRIISSFCKGPRGERRGWAK